MEHIMSMPSKKEQEEILRWEDEQHSVTTSAKIKAITADMISRAEERITKNYLPFAEKVDEHDGFISKIKRNFLGIVKG
jgi:deferrochelatase/peroxidase EfeB